MIRELHYDEVFDAQAHFRILLDSMARPGSINTLDTKNLSVPDGLNAASAFIAFALLNSDVTFHLNNKNETVEQYLKTNTFSQAGNSMDANFIFLSGKDAADIIFQTSVGEPEYPEKSTTLIIDVASIQDHKQEDSLAIEVSGPGVKDTQTCFIQGLNKAILEALKEQNAEYPLGIDTIVTDQHGRLLCFPRTSRLHWN